MVAPVKSRLTHYDNLGLPPAATPREIAEAFAKQIGKTVTSPEEAVEHANRVYAAYETLRDPAKRRAYDAAIGIWDQEASAEQRVRPFIGVGAPETLDQGLHVISASDMAGPRKKNRLRERPGSKADRQVLTQPRPRTKNRRPARQTSEATTEWPVPKTKSPPPRATDAGINGRRKGDTRPTRKKERRHAGQASRRAIDRESVVTGATRRKSGAQPVAPNAVTDVPANNAAPIKQNYAGARAGVLIVAAGLLTLAVGLGRENYDGAPILRQTPVAGEQPSAHLPSTQPAAGERALLAEQKPPADEASSFGFAGEAAEQVKVGSQDDQPATGSRRRQTAGGTAAAAPTRQSATRKAAATPPRQVQMATRQTPLISSEQFADRQSAPTPPQQAPDQQAVLASNGNAITQADAKAQVSRSLVDDKICKQLPSSWSRLPLRACLTRMEWKQVEDEVR